MKNLTNNLRLLVALAALMLFCDLYAQSDKEVLGSSFLYDFYRREYYSMFGDYWDYGELLNYYNQFYIQSDPFNSGTTKGKHYGFMEFGGGSLDFSVIRSYDFSLLFSIFDSGKKVNLHPFVLKNGSLDGLGLETRIGEAVNIAFLHSWLTYYNYQRWQDWGGGTFAYEDMDYYRNNARTINSRGLKYLPVEVGAYQWQHPESAELFAMKLSPLALTKAFGSLKHLNFSFSSAHHQSESESARFIRGTYDRDTAGKIDTAYIIIANTLPKQDFYRHETGKAALVEVSYNGHPVVPPDPTEFPVKIDSSTGFSYWEIGEGEHYVIPVKIEKKGSTVGAWLDDPDAARHVHVTAANNFAILLSYVPYQKGSSHQLEDYFPINPDDPEYPVNLYTVYHTRGNYDDFKNVGTYDVILDMQTANINTGVDFKFDIFGTDIRGGFFLNSKVYQEPNDLVQDYRAVFTKAMYMTVDRSFYKNRIKARGEMYWVDPTYTATYTEYDFSDKAGVNYHRQYHMVSHDPDNNAATKLPLWSYNLAVGQPIEYANLDKDKNDNSYIDYFDDFIAFDYLPEFYQRANDRNHNGTPDAFEDIVRPDYPYQADRRGWNIDIRNVLFKRPKLKINLDLRQATINSLVNDRMQSFDIGGELNLTTKKGDSFQNIYSFGIDKVRDNIADLRVYDGIPIGSTELTEKILYLPNNIVETDTSTGVSPAGTARTIRIVDDQLNFRNSLVLTPAFDFILKPTSSIEFKGIAKSVINLSSDDRWEDYGITRYNIIDSGLYGRIKYDRKFNRIKNLSMTAGAMAEKRFQRYIAYLYNNTTDESILASQLNFISILTFGYNFGQFADLNIGYQHRLSSSYDINFSSPTYNYSSDVIGIELTGKAQGLEDRSFMGVLGAKFSWYHAPDYFDVPDVDRSKLNSQFYFYVLMK